MDPYLLDWLNLLLRRAHVVAMIAWIGSSFYFVFLDNSLTPPTLPEKLHWFYWESHSTWLTGFGLFTLLYLLQARAFLIDPAVHA